jgi:hypothetical protein
MPSKSEIRLSGGRADCGNAAVACWCSPGQWRPHSTRLNGAGQHTGPLAHAPGGHRRNETSDLLAVLAGQQPAHSGGPVQGRGACRHGAGRVRLDAHVGRWWVVDQQRGRLRPGFGIPLQQARRQYNSGVIYRPRAGHRTSGHTRTKRPPRMKLDNPPLKCSGLGATYAAGSDLALNGKPTQRRVFREPFLLRARLFCAVTRFRNATICAVCVEGDVPQQAASAGGTRTPLQGARTVRMAAFGEAQTALRQAKRGLRNECSRAIRRSPCMLRGGSAVWCPRLSHPHILLPHRCAHKPLQSVRPKVCLL